MNELIIAPSVLSLDYSQVDAQLKAVRESAAQWIHYDVMDGHFVPNLTFGVDILRGFKKNTGMFMDVHLMIDDPKFYYPSFIQNGADMITFHYEALGQAKECIDLVEEIKSKGILSGIVIKPKTDVHVLEPILEYVDMVLIMSVEPGFGGQSFQMESLDKVAYLFEERQKRGLSYRIEMDGGINEETAKLAIAAGCDTLVAGSYVFKGDISEKVDRLLCLAQK